MLGIFHLLPLLKGWEWKSHIAERKAVIRGATPIEIKRIDETGWLFDILLLSNDCYGTMSIQWQGADLETRTSNLMAEDAKVVSAWAQDPAGWCQKYFRPNPNSTAGAFLTIISMGYQGWLMPYVPSVVVKLHLPKESTQNSAYIQAVAGVVAITNKKAFIRSLRRILDPEALLDIDPALLIAGPGKMKGEP